MRRIVSAALSLLALCIVPACAQDGEEDVESSDAALEAEWGEIDEDATPLTQQEKAEALGDVEDDQETDEAPEVEEPDAQAEAIAPPPALPKSCDPLTSLDLVVYTEGYSRPLLEALGKHANACSRVSVAVPKVAATAKSPDAALFPRMVKGKGVREFGTGFTATAELHWGGARDKKTGQRYPGWKNVKVVKLGPAKYATKVVPRSEVYDNDWFLKGVLFRQRMAKAGYRPQAGDSWHVNELESGWTRSRVAQKAIRDLVRGLAAGDQEYDAAKDDDPAIAGLSAEEKAEITKAARVKDLKGVVFLAALGRRRPGEKNNDAVKDALKQTLRRKRFWVDMNDAVSSFGLERYVAYAGVCKARQTLAAQSDVLADMIMELPLAASRVPRYKSGPKKGESPVATAMSYLSRNYQPVVNAAWGFRNDARSLADMGSFVRAQVYATRDFAKDHRTPDNRIGVYWNVKDGASPSESATYSDRVASALVGAYDGKDGNPIGACGKDGADACTCGD